MIIDICHRDTKCITPEKSNDPEIEESYETYDTCLEIEEFPLNESPSCDLYQDWWIYEVWWLQFSLHSYILDASYSFKLCIY